MTAASKRMRTSSSQLNDPVALSALSLPRPLRLLGTLVMKVTFLPKKIGVVTILKLTKADGVRNKFP